MLGQCYGGEGGGGGVGEEGERRAGDVRGLFAAIIFFVTAVHSDQVILRIHC